jgi:hypothetical protein
MSRIIYSWEKEKKNKKIKRERNKEMKKERILF